jgi:intraflagellar transport protein 140
MAEVHELDARVGLVAVHLGLKEDAQRLFAGAGRWDLLNQLHQAEGNWQAALEVAQKHDRLHLNTTRHAYAHHLEACGDHKGALDQYMTCKSGATEVGFCPYQ